jgi:hypothetical protein
LTNSSMQKLEMKNKSESSLRSSLKSADGSIFSSSLSAASQFLPKSATPSSQPAFWSWVAKKHQNYSQVVELWSSGPKNGGFLAKYRGDPLRTCS